MSLNKIIFFITSKLKPLIIKILPIEFLRTVKSRLISFAINKVKDGHVSPFDPKRYDNGINLIGFIRGEIGLGESCRYLANALKHSNFPFSIKNYQQISAMRFEDYSWDDYISETLPYNINLIHINPYELPLAYINLGKEAWDYRYNIGFWLWELEEFPESWLPALNLVDEIWSSSKFATIALRKVTNKPIYTVPYPLSVPTSQAFGRAYFSLPEENEQFLFLTMYDCNSTIERKNPMGAIHAYKKAFPVDQDKVGLVVKVNNAQQQDIDVLTKELQNHKNVYFITDTLSKTEVNSLLKTVDVFVSLHRAEGFGLPPAEAMWVGTPVIATNWSATTEFMTPDTACLVDFDFVTIQKDIGPYKAGNRWAEPHIDQAADYMLRLYQDKTFYQDLAKNGQEHIREVLSLQQAVDKTNKRISEIYKENEDTN